MPSAVWYCTSLDLVYGHFGDLKTENGLRAAHFGDLRVKQSAFWYWCTEEYENGLEMCLACLVCDSEDLSVRSEARSVKRDLLQCQKRPITVSKETYYSVKRDL